MNKVEVLKLAKENGLLIEREFHATQIRTYAFDELLALANACEKIGMEKAVKICEEQGREWDSDNVIADKNYAAHCAEEIRSATLSPTPHE